MMNNAIANEVFLWKNLYFVPDTEGGQGCVKGVPPNGTSMIEVPDYTKGDALGRVEAWILERESGLILKHRQGFPAETCWVAYVRSNPSALGEGHSKGYALCALALSIVRNEKVGGAPALKGDCGCE